MELTLIGDLGIIGVFLMARFMVLFIDYGIYRLAYFGPCGS